MTRHAVGSAASDPRRGDGVGTGARRAPAPLMLAVLGVVFGDIGTSPLYAMKTTFSASHNAVQTTPAHVTGIISLVIWSLLLIVTVKYVLLVLRADHHGEGGILSLATLVRGAVAGRRARRTAGVVGLIGAAFFFGDSVITPAISVLSAVEGLSTAVPGLSGWIVPAALGILVALFLVQRLGTSGVGHLFGPLMLIWFLTLAALGVPHILAAPQILTALLPTPGLMFLIDEPLVGFVALSAVMLVVTGAEAVYADIGHFGRWSVRRVWLGLVLPALVLNYLGQGALILRNPNAAAEPFFGLAPGWALLPLTVLAVVATIIASQAVITGSFSVARQAMRLRCLRPMTVRHTSAKAPGQIYMPTVNWALLAGVVVIVVLFGSSTALSDAYGLAVTVTFLLTTGLLVVYARDQGWPMPVIIVISGILVVVELSFLAANLAKFVSGGWLPLTIAAALLVLMLTWQWGGRRVTALRAERQGAMTDLVDRLNRAETLRIPGVLICPHAVRDTAPWALRHNVMLNGVLHEHTLVVRVQTLEVPRVGRRGRVEVGGSDWGIPGLMRVTVRFGFMETPDLPAALRGAESDLGLPGGSLEEAEYLLTHMSVRPAAGWHRPLALFERLFTAMSVFGSPMAATLHLPEGRTTQMVTVLRL